MAGPQHHPSLHLCFLSRPTPTKMPPEMPRAQSGTWTGASPPPGSCPFLQPTPGLSCPAIAGQGKGPEGKFNPGPCARDLVPRSHPALGLSSMMTELSHRRVSGGTRTRCCPWGPETHRHLHRTKALAEHSPGTSACQTRRLRSTQRAGETRGDQLAGTSRTQRSGSSVTSPLSSPSPATVCLSRVYVSSKDVALPLGEKGERRRPHRGS